MCYVVLSQRISAAGQADRAAFLLPVMKDLRLIDALSPTQDRIIDYLRTGNTRTAASEAAGISRTTFYRWLEENVAFCDAVKKAEATAEVGHVQCVANAAMKGSWQASAWWLERRRPRNWREIKSIDVRDIPTETLISLLEGEDRTRTGEAGGIDDGTGDSLPLDDSLP